MVICNNCGAEVTDSNFCYACGERVDNSNNSSSRDVCPKCGTKNNKNTTYCVECGFNLGNTPIGLTREAKEFEERRNEIIERYDKLATEFGIKNDDYFLTSVRRFNKLEMGTTKHSTANLLTDIFLVEHNGFPINAISKLFGNSTIIDGFFIIKEDKFVFMEIDNRDWEKVNAGINNFYFDKIVSMRITKGLGDTSKYEDITKRMFTSPHDIKRSIQNDINSLKATRFKDMVINNDSADMFDRLLIKLVDNTFYEIRLPSFEFGSNLVQLFEALRGQPQKVVIENQEPNKAQLLKEFKELFDDGVITEEEFNVFKKDLLK